MSARDDGGPVFPPPWTNTSDHLALAPNGEVVPPGYTIQLPGATLRDVFAWKALQGLCAEFEKARDEREIRSHYLATRSYEIADAMLVARKS